MALAAPAWSQSELHSIYGNSAFDFLGPVVGGHDLDGDSFDDIVVGAQGEDAGGTMSGAVHAFSGQTLEVLWSAYFDWDHDGVPDIAVGLPHDNTIGMPKPT